MLFYLCILIIDSHKDDAQLTRKRERTRLLELCQQGECHEPHSGSNNPLYPTLGNISHIVIVIMSAYLVIQKIRYNTVDRWEHVFSIAAELWQPKNGVNFKGVQVHNARYCSKFIYRTKYVNIEIVRINTLNSNLQL